MSEPGDQDGLWHIICGTRCTTLDANNHTDLNFAYDNDDDLDEFDAGDECGRWINGRLGRFCSLAGTEQCDWECPYS